MSGKKPTRQISSKSSAFVPSSQSYAPARPPAGQNAPHQAQPYEFHSANAYANGHHVGYYPGPPQGYGYNPGYAGNAYEQQYPPVNKPYLNSNAAPFHGHHGYSAQGNWNPHGPGANNSSFLKPAQSPDAGSNFAPGTHYAPHPSASNGQLDHGYQQNSSYSASSGYQYYGEPNNSSSSSFLKPASPTGYESVMRPAESPQPSSFMKKADSPVGAIGSGPAGYGSDPYLRSATNEDSTLPVNIDAHDLEDEWPTDEQYDEVVMEQMVERAQPDVQTANVEKYSSFAELREHLLAERAKKSASSLNKNK